MIGVEQIDHVRADVQDALPDPTELRIATCPKRITTGEITTDLDTGDEQADERVEISCVDGECVSSRQLTDLFVREQPADLVHGRIARPLKSASRCHGSLQSRLHVEVAESADALA